MVLFLFVVMMLDINFEKLREGFWKHLPFAGLVAVVLIAELAYVLTSPAAGLSDMPSPAALAADYSNVKDLGRRSTPSICIRSNWLRYCCCWPLWPRSR